MVNINDLTIGELKKILAMFGGTQMQTHSPMAGVYCVVRTQSEGVHIGTVAYHVGSQIVLTETRRILKWDGAFTLSDVAQNGIDPNGSRLSVCIPEILITEAIELIPATELARKTFELCHEK